MAATIAQTLEAPTAANINDVRLQISLPQLLDLALGAPEVGAVNFNILHNFLHILLHQINLQATKVEYHGENADRIKRMVISRKPTFAPQLYEYDVIDATGEVLQVRRDEDADILAEDIQLPAEEILEMPRAQTVKSVNGPPPTALTFKQLEQSVKQLQQQYQALEDLSTSPEVVERLKDSITDSTAAAWQFININKRLDANEQDTSLINERLDKLEDKVSKMEQWLINLQTITDILAEAVTAPTIDVEIAEEKKEIEAVTPTAEEKEEIEPTPTTAETVTTDDVIVPFREKEEKAKKISKVADDKIRKATLDTPRVTLLTNIAEIRQDIITLKTDVARIQQELQDLNERVARSEIPTTIVDMPSVQERPVVAKPIKEKIVEARDVTNLEQCLEAIKNVETTYDKALNDVTQRMVALETKIGHLLEKVNNMQEADKISDVGINKLVAKVQGIETDMEKIEQVMDRLFRDKEKQDMHINTLLEQIEFLKIVKVNKEDLEDALVDKADTQTVNRKVSHDRFNAACDDLARGLEEAIDKLTKQESIWQQALDEVQNEIATKVDKNEMMPLKEFVNDKLKSLQEKLKIIIEARREIEAAGTKKKLLRDVQCISCDKDVVMKTEEIGGFRLKPLPCTTSIKPYLTYELDKIRKQRRLSHGRNMIQFEAAVQEEIKKMKAKEENFAKTPSLCVCLLMTLDYLYDRYCGGSHTITTPQQRVMRTGHFLIQWGPETIQLTDGFIRGKDGRMYRSRPMRGKDVYGSSCWESQISEKTEPSECVSTTPRKSLTSRRNSSGNQKQSSKKQSKEPKVSEPEEKQKRTN